MYGKAGENQSKTIITTQKCETVANKQIKPIITIQKCETVPNKPNKQILRDFCRRAGFWSPKFMRIGLFGLFGTVTHFWMVIIGFINLFVTVSHFLMVIICFTKHNCYLS